jgi:hypothetical protein
MATVRRLGGFTASSDYDVPNRARGTNRLVFRVPVRRVQDAIGAFGRLGTVTGQSVDIEDVTARLGSRRAAVARAQERVDELRARVQASQGDAALRAALAAAEAALERAQAAQAALARRAALATVHLTLTTEEPSPPPATQGLFGGTLDRAGGRLAAALAWVLGAVVLLGPFAVLAALAAWTAARWRRRSARRLMEAR